MTTVDKWNQVPAFQSLQEEADYWSTHQIAPALLHASIFNAAGNESTTISLRIDPRMLARIKRIAAQRYLNYQSMIKHWLAERLEKELDNRNTIS